MDIQGHNRRNLYTIRKSLRASQTDAEIRLWYFLRAKRLLGMKFNRQYSVGPHVLDFYCHDLLLAIELDGGQHGTEEGRLHDSIRTNFLQERGITVVRFWNSEVFENIDGVLEHIAERIEQKDPPL
jgi:adenine-specific DNA-methyltransferase